MSILMKNNARIALLACFVLLGLQLWFPLALNAAEQPAAIAETSAPPAGSEDERGAPGLDQGIDLIAQHGGVLFGCRAQRVVKPLVSREDRNGRSLLRVAGLQPSAP